MDQKKNSYEAEKCLELLNEWYKILEFYMANTADEPRLRKDFTYVRDAIIYFNGDKKADHLKFAKMFKKLFAKQNKELAIENLELKKELAEKKMEERIKEIQENKDD